MNPDEMTNEEYARKVLKGKIVVEGGFTVVKYKWGVLIKTIPLSRVKEATLLE